MAGGRRRELTARRAALPDGPGPDSLVVGADRMPIGLESWPAAPSHPDLAAEVRAAATRLDAAPGLQYPTFRDACPVNRIAGPTGLAAIDVEHARFGHPAIDAVYPAIGHLGCMTRTRPGEAIAWPLTGWLDAEEVDRTAVREVYTQWLDDRFGGDLSAATVAWASALLERSHERWPDVRGLPTVAGFEPTGDREETPAP